MAIQGMFFPGDHVITTQLEHNSVLRPLYAMQKKGVELTIAASGQNGTADFDAIEAAIQANTKAIVCTHASTIRNSPCRLASSPILGMSVRFPVRFDAWVQTIAFVFAWMAASIASKSAVPFCPLAAIVSSTLFIQKMPYWKKNKSGTKFQ